MKTKHYIIPLLLTVVFFISLSSCSKDKDDDALSGNAGMTMKVDGAEWKSAMTTLFAEEHETSGMGEYHLVYIGGSRIIEKNSATEDDLVESLGLYINIPASKFRDPKGTYPIIVKETELSHAWGIFNSSTDIRDATLYVSGDPQDHDKSVGMLEITAFEIGNQSVFGQGTDVEGYTKLSGNFQLEVYPTLGTGSKLKLTEGKFNLTSGIGIDFGW